MTTTHAPVRTPDAAPAPRAALLTVVVLCFGGLSAAVMQTLVVPIQGELGALLHTGAANASWVLTATLVAGAVGMPISGRLGDMFGKQRVLVASAALLVAGSLLCAVSDSLLPMLAGRVLQGLAMGFIPVGIAMMREVTPPHLTPTAIAAMSATLGVGGAIGLPASAWVVENFDWHALFWFSGGLAAVVLVAIATLVPHIDDATGGRLDVVGSLGLSVGIVGVLVAISKGHDWGWTSGRTLGLLVGGAAVLVAWAAYELRTSEPLCDLRTTARRPVLLTNLAAIAVGFGMMASSVVVPQLLQLPSATGFGLGQTVLQAGLWMAPGGLVMMLFAPISSRLMGRIGARSTLVIGATVLGCGYLLATFLTGAPWQLLIASCVTTAGVGIGYAAMPTLILQAVPLTEAGAAVGINGLMRSIGTSLSTAVMTVILTSSTVSLGAVAIPSEAAFKTCFVVGAVAAFVGAGLALLVGRPGRGQEQSSLSGNVPDNI
ncbi:MAG TPA: MFS transporter [Nocardioides sp.]|nr:MFS transporter [Nocardioides sp.]